MQPEYWKTSHLPVHLLGKKGGAAGVPIDTNDEITRETLLTRDGAVVHSRVVELLGVKS